MRLELGSIGRLGIGRSLEGVGYMSFDRLRMGRNMSRGGKSMVIPLKLMMGSDIDFGVVMNMRMMWKMISTLTLPTLIVRIHLMNRRHLHISDSG